jgi:DnaJ-class molecular chaperone
MKNRRNYYRILHVQPDAPREVIRSSYRAMMQGLRMHPDLGGDDGNAALINEAYAVLTDPGQRAAYDSARQNPEWARGSENEPVSAGDPAPTPRHRCAFAVPGRPGGSTRQRMFSAPAVKAPCPWRSMRESRTAAVAISCAFRMINR